MEIQITVTKDLKFTCFSWRTDDHEHLDLKTNIKTAVLEILPNNSEKLPGLSKDTEMC